MTARSSHVFPYLVLAASLIGCGGGGGGGGAPYNPPTSVSPTPQPQPEPPPPPPPPAQPIVTFLHDFKAFEGDGSQPNGPLLQASDDNFYGTTRSGGDDTCGPWPSYCGVIFKITADGTETVFYRFGSIEDDGYSASGRLMQADDGALYGVTSSGGKFGGGTVFKITLEGAYTQLYSFGETAQDGLVPFGGLIQATDGNFYGVTASGGANHCFQIPQAGSNCGTVFKMMPDGQTSILYSFGSFTGDGVTPLAPLLEASDGNFYGTTSNGGFNTCVYNGANDCGTVFRLTPEGVITILHSFGPTFHEPIAPLSNLIEGRDGALYGATVSGGGGSNCMHPYGCGAIFKMTLDGQLSILYGFSRESSEDRSGPSQLIQASDGNFYGTTGAGDGTAFRLTPDGVFTTLHTFGPMVEKASNPVGGLIEANDGAFYGITQYSDAFGGQGMVFKLVLP